MTQKHICGLSGEEFNSVEEYRNHTSKVTGYKPTDLEHQGVRGLRIAEKALARTGSLKAKQKATIEKQLTSVREGAVEEKLKVKRRAKVQIFGRERLTR